MRRDNANCVKKIIGGFVNILLDSIDEDEAIRFIKYEI